MERMTGLLRNKKGSQMVEAAIVVPVVILAAMLLIRMFVFYIEILTAGIEGHREAMEAQDSYKGVFMRTYETERHLTLAKGGLLMKDAGKKIKIRTYLVNEDILVRSGEAIGE